MGVSTDVMLTVPNSIKLYLIKHLIDKLNVCYLCIHELYRERLKSAPQLVNKAIRKHVYLYHGDFLNSISTETHELNPFHANFLYPF